MSDLNHEKSVLKMLERQPYPGIKNKKISDFYKDVLGAQDISKVLQGDKVFCDPEHFSFPSWNNAARLGVSLIQD